MHDLDAAVGYWIHIVGIGIEIFGVLVIVLGIVWSTFLYVGHRLGEQHYTTYKIRIGRSLLLGLEVLVAADIVKTIALDLLYEPCSVGWLGIDTYLSELDPRAGNRRSVALAARQASHVSVAQGGQVIAAGVPGGSGCGSTSTMP